MSEVRTYTNKLLEEKIDESFIQYVGSFIGDFSSDLEKAIAIYIKISQIFWYNPNFLVDRDYDSIDNLSDITMENNQIICLHWAIIYSKLLDIYGVDNKLLGDDEHLRVKVITSKYIMFADATKHGVEYRDYLLSDLTNTKVGIKINSLGTLSSTLNKELDKEIEAVYNKLNMKFIDTKRVDDFVEKFRVYNYRRMNNKEAEGLNKIDKKEIDKRISFINRFYYILKDLGDVEKLQIFTKYYKEIFEGFNFDNLRCLTLCEKNEHVCSLLKLIVVSDGDNIYYYLESAYGFVEYSKDKLIDTLIERNIYFKYDRCCILGFKDEEVKKLIK